MNKTSEGGKVGILEDLALSEDTCDSRRLKDAKYAQISMAGQHYVCMFGAYSVSRCSSNLRSKASTRIKASS